MKQKTEIRFQSISENEGFARVCAGAMATRLDPTIEEIEDLKTAVSEAVTNAIVHGYGGREEGIITMEIGIEQNTVEIVIADQGRGIADVEKAREPFFTTLGGEERSGMGFTIMETFMDSLAVESEPGQGTRVTMTKTIERGKK